MGLRPTKGDVGDRRSVPIAEETFIPIAAARHELRSRDGRPIARATVLALGAKGELDVREICGRYVVTQSSIDTYRARFAAGEAV
jgi:hypothetical protein